MSERYQMEALIASPEDLFQKDPEFEAMLGKLSDEEYRLLKEDILEKKKITNPLVFWVPPHVHVHCEHCGEKHTPKFTFVFGVKPKIFCTKCYREFWWLDIKDFVLIDGYNRYRIANELGMESLPTECIRLETRDDVKEWIAKNQYSRRNLSEKRRAYCLGLIAERLGKPVGRPPLFIEIAAQKEYTKYDIVQPEDIAALEMTKQQVEVLKKNREEEEKKGAPECTIYSEGSKRVADIAKEVKVAKRTLQLAKAFQKSVDSLESAIPGIRESLFSSKIPIKTIVKAGKVLSEKGVEEAKEVLEPKKEQGKPAEPKESIEDIKKKVLALLKKLSPEDIEDIFKEISASHEIENKGD